MQITRPHQRPTLDSCARPLSPQLSEAPSTSPPATTPLSPRCSSKVKQDLAFHLTPWTLEKAHSVSPPFPCLVPSRHSLAERAEATYICRRALPLPQPRVWRPARLCYHLLGGLQWEVKLSAPQCPHLLRRKPHRASEA